MAQHSTVPKEVLGLFFFFFFNAFCSAVIVQFYISVLYYTELIYVKQTT